MSIEITKFRKFEKNSLRGFLSIYMSNIGLEIRDATYHQKDGKRWIGLPAKQYESDGETKYSYVIKFIDKEKYAQFQKAAIEALDQYLVAHEGYPTDDDIPL